MEMIRILTRTVTAEAELQKKLQVLGYEVFVSSRLLELFLEKKGAKDISLFKTVILTETISDAEAQQICEYIGPKGVRIFRIEENSGMMEANFEGTERLYTSLPADFSMNILREKLAETPIPVDSTIDVQFVSSRPDFSYKDNRFLNFVNDLSQNEKRLFDILVDANGHYVSRKALSEQLWGRDVSNSTLTQLSQLIFRIRKKMDKCGLNGELVVTNWKEGYAVSKSFFKQNFIAKES